MYDIKNNVLELYDELNLPLIPCCSWNHKGMSSNHIEKCTSPGKVPVVKNWSTLLKDKRKILSREELEEVFSKNNYNVGLVLGNTEQYNLVAIDIDGEEGLRAWEEIKNTKEVPESWEFITGGNGYRVIYALPKGFESKKKAIVFQKEHSEISFLCDGQQTIIPPSKHNNGNYYVWIEGKSPYDINLAMAPIWILELVAKSNNDIFKSNQKIINLNDAPEFGSTLNTKYIFKIGNRNTNLFRYLCGMSNLIQYNNKTALLNLAEEVNIKYINPPLELKEINTIVESVLNTTAENIIFLVETNIEMNALKELNFNAYLIQDINLENCCENFKYKTIYIKYFDKIDELFNKLCDTVKEFNVIEYETISVTAIDTAIKNKWDWCKSKKWKKVAAVLGKKNIVEYRPLPIWQNLKVLLDREKIDIKYNLISKEIESSQKNSSKSRNIMLTDIYTLNIEKKLNISRAEVRYGIEKIARMNEYNPFIDMLKENKNNDSNYIEEVFNCIEINPMYEGNREIYLNYFKKWCLNVVRMAQNTLESSFESQGVLVLQGPQGVYKSTFFKKLINKIEWFKGGNDIDPGNKDSLRKNTKYILVELGELETTLKRDQAKLKSFISDCCDEYRNPYAELEEKYPRVTSFCATVNTSDFLKDETGSRRWWVIPCKKCNIDKLSSLDMQKFWGAIFGLYCSGEVKYYLSFEEIEKLNVLNRDFNKENDISILIDEIFDWEIPRKEWRVYNVNELCEILEINQRKELKTELERKGFSYCLNSDNKTQRKKGYKLPPIKRVISNKFYSVNYKNY